MHQLWRVAVLAALLGAVPVVAADTVTLAQLRATLQRLTPRQPLQARVQVRVSTRSGSDSKPKVVSGQLALTLDDGADGLGIHLPAAMLAAAARESAAHQRNPDVPMPVHDALEALDPAQLVDLADFAPALLRALEGATLTGQADVTHAGTPAHVMHFRIPSLLSKAQRSAIKHYQGTLTVWLGADGVPVAMHEERRYSGRRFFISFTISGTRTATLVRRGDRLLSLRYQSRQGGSGLGHHQQRDVLVILKPQPQPPPPQPAPTSR